MPEMFMVCLWPMPYKVNSPWPACLWWMSGVLYPKTTDQVYGSTQNLFFFLRSWQMQQFIICHVNLHMVRLNLEVQSVIAAWYEEAKRERWLTTVLWLKQIQLSRGSRFIPSELRSTLNIYIWMKSGEWLERGSGFQTSNQRGKVLWS